MEHKRLSVYEVLTDFDWFKLAWIWQMPLMHRAVQEKSSLPVKSLYFVEYVSLFHKSVTTYLKKKSVSIEWKSVTNYGIHIMDTLSFYNYEHPKKGHILILLSRLARDS